MNNQYTMNNAFKDNNSLRKSFNELANETFGIDFEEWYQNGYWGENYIPYSIIDAGKVVANASANIMNFDYMGNRKNYIQIGTVMTNKAYRNQGLSRSLIEKIIKDYRHKADGFFLFGNDSVLDFYPKFGFRRGLEYQYVKDIQINKEKCAVHISMESKKDMKAFEEVIINSISNSRFEMKQNANLIMFYVTKFMKNNIFYIKEISTYVIAEIKDGQLTIFNVFSPEESDINQVIEAFGCDIKTVTLGFTPIENKGFTMKELHKEDTTLFLLGKDFENFEQCKIMFPLLSHA